MSSAPAGREHSLSTCELFEELDATLARALMVSDELRRRFGCHPETALDSNSESDMDVDTQLR